MLFIYIGQYFVRHPLRIWHKHAAIRKEQYYQYNVLYITLYFVYKRLQTLFFPYINGAIEFLAV